MYPTLIMFQLISMRTSDFLNVIDCSRKVYVSILDSRKTYNSNRYNPSNNIQPKNVNLQTIAENLCFQQEKSYASSDKNITKIS